MFTEIDRLKARLDAKRPLSRELIKMLQDDWLVRFTYHSNAIEGNTLSIFETKAVLEHGVTVAGKTLAEHLEAINHKAAILYLLQIVGQDTPLNEWEIKNIHQLILKGIDDDNAGRYRCGQVMISGASHIPPAASLLLEKMQALMAWYQSSQDLHPVYRAAKLHADFVAIHPFVDGNGRTSRLLMNLVLMQAGYLPSIITVENRLAYYEALDTWATSGDELPFVQFVVDTQLQAFWWYGKVIGIV